MSLYFTPNVLLQTLQSNFLTSPWTVLTAYVLVFVIIGWKGFFTNFTCEFFCNIRWFHFEIQNNTGPLDWYEGACICKLCICTFLKINKKTELRTHLPHFVSDLLCPKYELFSAFFYHSLVSKKINSSWWIQLIFDDI